tara:strand:- start:163 stop:846 length:684 start_codon:yes stop_codon:yes gene_type:complete
MNLSLKKYKQIIKLKKRNNFSDFDIITNYGLFSGDSNLYKTLIIFDLIKQTSKVKGDVIELGIHRGNTSLLIKKILDIFKIKKNLYLLDHFKGLIHYNKKDTKLSEKLKDKYVGKRKQIEQFIKFFNLKNIKIIDKDATTLKSSFFHKKKFSLAYFDMDLYLPTLRALEAIDKSISVGGYIVFDEGNKKLWSEKLAIKDFLKRNKNYKKIAIDKVRQPDVVLKKIKN